MLSRASSDAGTRLRRSKSASTVHRPAPHGPEPLDPALAQKHAVLAATTAYARAHGNNVLDRSNSRASQLSRAGSNAKKSSEGRHFPPRESSLRFIDPQKASYVPNVPRHPRTSIPGNAQRPRSQTVDENALSPASTTFNENSKPTPQPRRGTIPSSSSASQIRKARSMYYASSVQTGSPVARPPAKYLVTPPPASPVPSKSILSEPGTITTPPLLSPRLPITISTNETINNARDRYLQGFQQRREVRSKPSLFLAPFKKRQDKDKVKDSGTRIATVISIPPVQETAPPKLPSESHLQKERRSLSASFRDKIKKVFRKSSNSSTTLPVQQIDASRDYFGDYSKYIDSAQNTHTSLDHIPSPDERILAKVRSRSPSLEGGRPALARSSPRASPVPSESGNAFASGSRVTSWANSSVTNTISSGDVKRLSVIHEAKSSISSIPSSMPTSLKRRALPVPTLAAFREPMPMEMLSEEVSTPVDPKRVFSALMKEIHAAEQAAGGASAMAGDGVSDVFVTIEKNVQSSPANAAARSRTSSIKSSLSRVMKSTIRAVSPDPPRADHSDQEGSIHGAVRIPRFDTASPESATESAHESGKTTVAPILSKKPSRNRIWHPPPPIIIPTPEQIERRVEKSKGRWKTPLEEGHFPFFPLSTKRTFTVTSFKKTLSRKPSKECTMPTPGFRSPTPPPEPSVMTESPPTPTAKPTDFISPLSPSIYSRHTDGASIRPNDSAISLAQGDSERDDTGTAVIITSHPVKTYTLGSPTAPRHSGRSSKDWRAWLSREVSELGHVSQENIAIDDQYTSNHHREDAQISSEDVTIGGFSNHSYTTLPRQRAQIRQGSDSSTSSKRQSDIPGKRMVERFPYLETAPKSRASSGRSSNRTSSSKSLPLRSMPDLANVYSDFSSRIHILNPAEEGTTKNAETPLTKKDESRKENIGTSSPTGTPAPSRLQSRHLQPTSGNQIRTHSALATYTSSEDPTNAKRASSPLTPSLYPRLRIQDRNTGLSRVLSSSRPKSSVDLRSARSGGMEARQGRVSPPRRTMVGEADGKIAAMGTPTASYGSPEAFMTGAQRTMHLRHSHSQLSVSPSPSPSSHLARFSTPTPPMPPPFPATLSNSSPGPRFSSPLREELREEYRFGTPSRSNSLRRLREHEREERPMSPGHRMAERFCRERRGKSGAGTPVSEGEGTVGEGMPGEEEGIAFL